MKFFDCNCMLGQTATGRERPFESADALLAEMDRIGIAEALVYSPSSYQSHPMYGNERILKDVAGYNRLYPCWVVLPPMTNEMPKPDKLVREMKDANVRAVRVFPEAHKFPFSRTALGDLFKTLEDERIPILVDSGRNHWSETKLNWDEVFAISTKYPELPIILLREGGTTQRILYGSWKQHKNLYLETSYLQVPECYSYICREFGAERLLFGTNMPISDPGGPIAMSELSEISSDEKAGIAGNNIRHLLGLTTKKVEEPKSKTKFRIFDAHGHLGRWETVYCPIATADETVKVMDRLSIEKFAISDFLAIGVDYYEGNNRVGEAIRKFPDRIIGYAVYNPNYESRMKDEMKRCFEDLGMSAIKLHCDTHLTSVEDQRYKQAFVIANEYKVPILVHGGPSPSFLRHILSEYPNIHYIQAHFGGGTVGNIGQILDIAHEFPNMIFDLASSVCNRGFLAYAISQIGANQITYGSDFPLMDFGWQLGRILYADITDLDKQKILFDNANRIFSIKRV